MTHTNPHDQRPSKFSVRPALLSWSSWFAGISMLVVAIGSTAIGQDELQARRAQVEAMSANDKQELLAKKARFDRLAPEEQDRLRQLHEAIARDQNREQLRQVMQSYTTWLASLPANDRADLLDLRDPAARLAKIRELKLRYEDHELAKVGLTPNDARLVLEWFDKTIDTHLESAQGNAAGEPAGRSGNDRIQQRFLLIGRFMRGNTEILEQVSPNEIQGLLDRLSDRATETYAALSTEGQRKLLADWIRAAGEHKFRPRPMSDQELDRVIAQLPDEDRQQLELLPREKIYEELRRRMSMSRGFGPRRNGRGDRPDGRRNNGGPGGFRGRGERPPGPPPGDFPPDFGGPPPEMRDGERFDPAGPRRRWRDEESPPEGADAQATPSDPAPAANPSPDDPQQPADPAPQRDD